MIKDVKLVKKVRSSLAISSVRARYSVAYIHLPKGPKAILWRLSFMKNQKFTQKRLRVKIHQKRSEGQDTSKPALSRVRIHPNWTRIHPKWPRPRVRIHPVFYPTSAQTPDVSPLFQSTNSHAKCHFGCLFAHFMVVLKRHSYWVLRTFLHSRDQINIEIYWSCSWNLIWNWEVILIDEDRRIQVDVTEDQWQGNKHLNWTNNQNQKHGLHFCWWQRWQEAASKEQHICRGIEKRAHCWSCNYRSAHQQCVWLWASSKWKSTSR